MASLDEIRKRFSEPLKESPKKPESPPLDGPKIPISNGFETLGYYSPYGMSQKGFTLEDIERQLENFLTSFIRNPCNPQTKDRMRYGIRELLKSIVPIPCEVRIEDGARGFDIFLIESASRVQKICLEWD